MPEQHGKECKGSEPFIPLKAASQGWQKGTAVHGFQALLDRSSP